MMWFEDLPANGAWSALWHGLILCRCGAIRTYEKCPVCAVDVTSATIELIDRAGNKTVVAEAHAGAEGRYEDYLYLELIQREWFRPSCNTPDDQQRIAEISDRASIVLLFWSYFESRIERLLSLGLRTLSRPLRDDILGRYSSVGSRMDRLYKLVYGTTYFEDLRAVGAGSVADLLAEIRKKRNEFAHGNPAAITNDLAERVVAALKDDHFAWIRVFNRRIAALPAEKNGTSEEKTVITETAPPLGRWTNGALEQLIKVVVIGAPVLYTLGRVYASSYWRELHLPSSLMDYSTEDYLYMGFISIVNGIARAIGLEPYTTMAHAIVFTLLVALLATAAHYIDRWISRGMRARIVAFQQRVEEAKKSKHGSLIHAAQFAAAVWSGLTIVVFVLFCSFVLLVIPIALVDGAGKQQAIIERNEQAQRPARTGAYVRPPILTQYVSDGVPLKAQLVECSEQWCVIFDQGDFAAIPSEAVHRIGKNRGP